MNEISGDFVDCSGRFAIVAGRFNRFITDSLISGATDALARHGIDSDAIDCIWVPGAFEIPQAAAVAARSGKYAAVITLGAVIRGATPHFDFVAGECAGGIARLNLVYRQLSKQSSSIYQYLTRISRRVYIGQSICSLSYRAK